MINLKRNFVGTLILHDITDTDNAYRAMHHRFIKLETSLNNAFKRRSGLFLIMEVSQFFSHVFPLIFPNYCTQTTPACK